MPKTNIDNVFMEIAHSIGKLSYAKRLQVGCIVVKDGNILSMGYNGMPYGFENECEFEGTPEHKKLRTKPEVLHAESNAISKLARSTQSSDGADLYVTDSPCFDCAKLIIQSGIKAVYYRGEYRIKDGLVLLEDAGIKVERVV
jgi:dCMP deaminase